MQTEHKIRTLAHQLIEILGAYARSFEQWRDDPSDLGRYERIHANLDLVRVLTDKAFPGGRGELGELMLCHHDLKLLVLRRHMARRNGGDARDDSEAPLRALMARHASLVDTLSRICAQRSGHAEAAPAAYRPAATAAVQAGPPAVSS